MRHLRTEDTSRLLFLFFHCVVHTVNIRNKASRCQRRFGCQSVLILTRVLTGCQEIFTSFFVESPRSADIQYFHGMGDPQMTEEKPRQLKSKVIGIRLSIEELKRFEILVERAKKRNTLSDRAAVARELMGFPAVPRTITDEDHQFLISGTERVEVAAPGRLTRKYEGLIQKVKEILLYGHHENPEENLSHGISVNITSIWSTLKSREPQKEKKKSKTKEDSSSRYIDSNGSEETRSPG